MYVTRGGTRRLKGMGVRGSGGTGGVNHAEQQAWQASANAVKNVINAQAGICVSDRQPVVVEFEIDSPVCPGCRAWFENGFWITIQLTGGGTAWRDVSPD